MRRIATPRTKSGQTEAKKSVRRIAHFLGVQPQGDYVVRSKIYYLLSGVFRDCSGTVDDYVIVIIGLESMLKLHGGSH